MAALDYFIATTLTGAPGLSEELETMLTSRTSAYPFGYDAAVYALYPVLQTHEGPGGRSIIDMTLEEPIETYLQPYGDLVLFIPADFEHEREENPYRILLPFYAIAEGIDERYIWIGYDYYAGYSSQLSLTRTDSGFAGQRKDSMFEAHSALEFILVPDGSGDPRPAGFRCEGAPLTRLEGAVFATPLRWWEPVQLYDEPSGTATEIEQDSQMLIALNGEPECFGGFTWWPVKVIIESEEQTGWIQENMDSTQYFYDRIDYD
jgi:hypothetical protein